MQTAFLKIMDKYLGRLASVMFRPQQSRQIVEPSAVLFIRPGGIGDAVLLLPAIHALTQAYPACRVDILAERRNAAVFLFASGIRTVYRYDSLAEFSSVLRNRYDVVIDTEQWYRLSAVVARLVRAPVKIGYGTNERKRLFTHPVAYSHDDYEADSFLKLLHPLGISASLAVLSPFIQIPEPAVRMAASLLDDVEGKPVVALFPGSSVREKCWGTDRFASLAARLTEKGAAVVVVGGREEVSAGEEMTREGSGRNLAGKTSLGETAAIIARADVLVSSDSGLLHIAAGLHVPTVALFGPSNVDKWAPRGNGHRVVGKRLTCSPCSRYGTIPPCPHDVRCMTDITVDEVVKAVELVLVEQGKSREKCDDQ